MQHLHILPLGKMLVSFVLICALLCCFGCTESTDLYFSLPNGYAVSRLNGSQIVLIYNDNWENELGQVWDGIIVLPNYYVKGFCYHGSFIGVFGTQTETPSATMQERESGAIQYYLLDSQSSEMWGPFASKAEYDKVCTSMNIPIVDDWYEVTDYPRKWISSYK